jgi:hypothetical protein
MRVHHVRCICEFGANGGGVCGGDAEFDPPLVFQLVERRRRYEQREVRSRPRSTYKTC